MFKSAVSKFFSSNYTTAHSKKTNGSANRWQGQSVPSYFYQNEESFMRVSTVFSEILKVIECSVENWSCVETRKCHSFVLTEVI